MPSHSLIFFCLVPFCVSHLQSQKTTDLKLTIYQYISCIYFPKWHQNTEKNKTFFVYLRQGVNLLLILLTSSTGLWFCGAAWDPAWGCSSSCRSLCYQRPDLSGPAPAYACCRGSPSHETSNARSYSGSWFGKMTKLCLRMCSSNAKWKSLVQFHKSV